MKNVFVFGTLKPMERLNFIIVEALEAQKIPVVYAKATIKGTIYGLAEGYPVAQIGEGHDGTVHGYIVTIDENERVINRLHGLEGYMEKDLENSMYILTPVVATLIDGTEVETFTYIYNVKFFNQVMERETSRRADATSVYDAKTPFRITEFLSGNWNGEENHARFQRATKKLDARIVAAREGKKSVSG